MKSFKELDIKRKYATKTQQTPLDFYSAVIPLSKEIYFKLGYFSSYAISVLALPLTHFLLKEGTLSIVTNHIYKKEDAENLLNIDLSEEQLNRVGKMFKDDPEEFKEVLREGTALFYDCLNYLQKKNRLIIQPVLFGEEYDLSHFKEFVAEDYHDNLINATGSCNLTANGILRNGESFAVIRSWDSTKDQVNILNEREGIKRIINGIHPDFHFVSPDRILKVIHERSNNKELNDLLDDAKEYSKKVFIAEDEKNKLLVDEFKNAISEYKASPRFPHENPYPYQITAYKEWVKNDYNGLFAMATGTGKTLTAIYCLIQENMRNGLQKNIFIVPGKELVNQWFDELKQCNFRNIFKWFSENRSLKKEIDSIKILRRGRTLNIVITYDSFYTDRFLKLFKDELHDFTVVFDEAHNIGAPKFKNTISKIELGRRIGLSATPLRLWDDNNDNAFIENLFNTEPPYTYNYSMELAIDKGFLVPYNYYPIFTYTNDEEYEDYLLWTSRLYKYEEGKRILNSNAAINRQLVLDRAIRKEDTLIDIIDDLIRQKNMKFTLVYCSKGDNDVGERKIHVLGERVACKFPNLNLQFFLGETKDRDLLLQDFESGTVDMLLAIKCLDEGVNVPRTQNAIFLASGKNYREFIQRRGRVLRKYNKDGIEKTHANLYDIVVFPTLEQYRNNKSIGEKFIANEFKRIYEFNKLSKERDNSFRKIDNELKRYGLTQYYLENLLKEYD